jgi:drug/metabolite transporter (DMT)-like permease
MKMTNSSLKWLYLFILSLIWGTSFILIKKGLIGLTDYQVGSLRIVLTSIFLFSIGFKSLRTIKKKHWMWIALSGFVSSFFPAFLFAKAQSHIDSSVASLLNSLTPLATVVIGIVLFKILSSKNQIWGVLVGLAGSVMLVLIGADLNPSQNYWYSILILIATLGYALNVNIIKKYLYDIGALAVTTGNFLFIFLPALIILYLSGFFETVLYSEKMQISFGYVAILSLVGTAFAKVIFNKLVQIASPVFASSVTYTMPIVAVIWGIIDGETFNILQALAATLILLGVFLANKK